MCHLPVFTHRQPFLIFPCCRVLAADVREVYSSICQLFELWLLEVFRCFSDVPLADIVGGTRTSPAGQPQPSVQPPEEVSRLTSKL